MKNYLKQTRVHSLKKIDGRLSKRLHWNLITICNYHCDYCYSRAADSQWNKMTNAKIVEEVLESISNINGTKEVFLLGGEPTKHPKYIEIVERLYNTPGVDVLGNITNGGYNDYKQMVDKHKPFKDKFYWNITYHPSEVTDENLFRETIKYVYDEGYIINVNLLLDTRYKEKINSVFEFCTVNKIPIYPSFLFEGDEFTPFDNYEWLREINEKYTPPRELYYHTETETHNYNDLDTYMLNLNGFKGWRCVNNSFVIPVNENRFSQFCTGKTFTVEEINAGSSEIICPLDTCVCPSRLGDEKFRTTTE